MFWAHSIVLLHLHVILNFSEFMSFRLRSSSEWLQIWNYGSLYDYKSYCGIENILQPKKDHFSKFEPIMKSFKSSGTHGATLHFKESNSNLMATKNSNTNIPIVNWIIQLWEFVLITRRDIKLIIEVSIIHCRLSKPIEEVQ